MHILNLVKFCKFVPKILSRKDVLVSIKGHYSGTNVRKIMCNNPNLDLVNMNAYIQFGEIQKQNFGINKGHNSSTNLQKMMCNNPKLDLVNRSRSGVVDKPLAL